MEASQRRHSGSKPFSAWFAGFILFIAPIAVYWPCMNGPFIWDDLGWTHEAEWCMSSFAGLWQIWTHPTALQQYFPVTATSFWIDHQLWGYNTFPYHLENVILHSFSCLLFWGILNNLGLKGSWFAAAMFAVHPVMVESVAWITERKNALCMVVVLGAFFAFGQHMRWWRVEDRSSWRWYGLAFVLFVLALLTKVTAIILPPSVLLVAWWNRGRIDRKLDVMPIIPFFVVAVVVGYFIGILENRHFVAMGEDLGLAFLDRFVLAGQTFWFYIAKLMLPVSLCSIYESWPVESRRMTSWLGLMGAMVIVFFLWHYRSRLGRGPIVAILYFIGGLFPVLGFLNVYGMRIAWVADRWVYLPSLAFFIVFAHCLTKIHPGYVRHSVAAIILTGFAILTWNQAGKYRSVESFWNAAIAGNTRPWKAENDFGVALLHQNRFDEAIAHFRESMRVAPDVPDPQVNLGNAYLSAGNPERARETWESLLARRPDLAPVHYNLGVVHSQAGRIDEAMHHFRRAIEIVPTMSVAHYDLGNLLFMQRQFSEAATHFQRTLEIRPGDPSACTSIGNVFFVQGKHAEALRYYLKALQRMPDQVEALSNGAWIMSTSPNPELRDGDRAVKFGEKCVAITDEHDPGTLGTLASAYAEVGRFVDAANTATKALQLAESQGKVNLVSNLRNELSHYLAGKAYRDEIREP